MRTEELQVALHATLLDAQRDDAAQMLLRHQDIGLHDGLAHVFDGRQIRQLRRAVHVDDVAVLQRQLVDHGRCRGDQVQIILALEPLLDDFHVQHAEKADAETEAQSIGAFRLVLQGSIVQGQFLQCVAEILEIIRADREEPGIHLGLDPLEAGQHLHVGGVGQGQGVAHRRAMDVLDTGDDEAHLTGLEVGGGGVLGIENTDAVDLMHLAGGFHQHLVALLDPAVTHAHQRDHTQVVVEPGIDDQRLQRRLDLAGRRRNGGDQALQHLVDTHAALGAAGDGICGVDADDVFDLGLDLVRVGLGQVHLVQHGHHFQPLLDGGVAVGYRLRLDALTGIHHQQRTFAGRQRAAHLVGEVDVAGGVDEVELVGLAVPRLVMKGHAVSLDGDAALALEIHRVENLGSHLTFRQATAHLNEPIGQRRLAMIDVRNDGKITDMTQVTHN